MTDENRRIAEAIARGRKAAEELGPTTDAMTETIAQIERLLAESRFGVEASIEMIHEDERYSEEGESYQIEGVFLGFRKEGKGWRLMVDRGFEDHWSSDLLVNASRDHRLLAVEKLPDLIEKLAEEAERKLAEVESKRATAQAVLDALRSGKSSP